MKEWLKGFLWLCGLVVGLAGCESNDCMLSSGSYCNLAFVDGEGKGVKLLDTLTVSTTGDNVIINRKLGTEGMDLPLSYTATVDTFTDLPDDACAIFLTAAPLIGSCIEERIQEFTQKPAVSTMDGHHTETA